ncbi:MAG: NYN domain-containing protein [Deltaproteobacteria bacterium]|nr:NYN domain-containing protein [Deltaproteobacteria bacterium]
MEKSNIAVFIDFENIGNQDIFDAKSLIEKLREKGGLVIKKAYADWGRYASYKRQMLENSIELTELPSHGNRGKNSADIKLVTDALETAITRDYIDTFVIVSGDSDYIPLISKIREYNKSVIVIGVRDKTSKLLKGYCDELIYYSTLVGNQEYLETDIPNTYSLLIRAVQLLERNGSTPRGSTIKAMMRQLDSSFDESDYGFSQFKKYLQSFQSAGLIKLAESETGGDLVVTDYNEKNFETPTVINSIGDISNFNKLLAMLRKKGMQFIGSELQNVVIKEIHSELVENSHVYKTKGELINSIMDNKLCSYIESGELSKCKIGSIFKIFQISHIFESKKDDEDSPTLLKINSDYLSFEKFREAHDAVFIYFSKSCGVSMSVLNKNLHNNEIPVENLEKISVAHLEKKIDV